MNAAPYASYLHEYMAKCRSGEILVGRELLQMFDILDGHLRDPDIRFELDEAHKRIKFIESQCKHFEAPYAGKPFLLELFQKAFIVALYGFKIYDEEIGRWVRLYQEALFLVGRKNGKALALDTPIPTPNGWRTMGDLRIGDYVFGKTGRPVQIVTVSEVFTGHRCYEVTFEDGEKIVADGEHIWTVMTKKSRSVLAYRPKSKRKLLRPEYRERDGYFNITTSEMVADFKRVRRDGKGIEYKYRVPMNQPIEYPVKQLPISPYLLGFWLGDGESSGARISISANELTEVLNLLKAEGGEVTSVRDDRSCKRAHLRYRGISLKSELLKLQLINNKHIPRVYLESSVEQRLELLRGLMDSDGTCSRAGQCEFVQKNKAIIKGISELLAGLGIKHTIIEKTPTCRGKICDKVYRVSFFTDKDRSCFKLSRKHERLKDRLNDRMLNKSIIDIQEVESVPTKCIGVDSDDHLYLAGPRMTVTHNTPFISALNLSDFFCGPEGMKILCSSNDYEQADLMFQAINAMREESKALERVTRKNLKGIFFGNPKNRTSKGKFSYRNKGHIRKISAKTGAKEGRNIAVGSVDEVHEMLDNSSTMPIRQALSTQDEPLYFELTTEGFTNDGYLDGRIREARQVLNRELDRPRWLIWLYTQDSEQEIWQDERTWVKSNPGLGSIKKWSFLRSMIEEAKTNKATRVFVLAKDFNVKQNNAAAWLTPEVIENKETFELESFRDAFALGAVDLSKSGDLASARALLMREGKKYTLQHYFVPQSKLDKLTGDEKKRYEEWRDAGMLTVSPGNENDFRLVTAWFVKLYRDYGIRFYRIGYDKWSAVYWVKEMEEYGFDMQRVDQTWGAMSEPMRLVEADLESKLLVYNDHPIDRFCLENTALAVNSKQEQMPVKVQGKDEKKIDGAVTMIIVYRVYLDHRTEFLQLVERAG